MAARPRRSPLRLALETLEDRCLLAGGLTDAVRFATFNASLNRATAGQLFTDLSTPNNAQAAAVAEVIQRVRPDVVLINEFDYDTAAPALFQQNYLSVGRNGAQPIEYGYVYIAPSNTGVASGFDLNNNGQVVTTPGAAGYGDDALGFVAFPGQFGMVLFSKYEILTDEVRTFQNFLWKDMPGNRLTEDATVDNPATPVNENLSGFYSPEEIAVLRLSSKSHWDVPVRVNGEVIHVLTSHPTPPVFDGPEDRNGKRNADEIRLFADYVTPGAGDYLYDDAGNFGGLEAGAKFVIMGDQNSDPFDGDSVPGAIQQLWNNPFVNANDTPFSAGGPDAAARQGRANATHRSDPRFDTADFADGAPGNLRADYVLPSSNLDVLDARVFWPTDEDPLFRLVGDFNPALPGGFPTSDHRLVYADVAPLTLKSVSDIEFLGEVTFPTGLQFNGTDVGGLSGLAYDPVRGVYYAISDDRSQLDPARYYTLKIDLADGSLDSGDVTFTAVTTLLRPDGTPFPINSIDFEGIALAKDGSLYVSSEGEARPDIPRVTDPAIFQFTAGTQTGSLAVPDKFDPAFRLDSSGTTQIQGIRNNLAFESLTITPDGRYLYTATENALSQDGPAAAVDVESPSRIVKYDLLTGEVVAEFVYVTDPVADTPIPATAFATNGLVELLALDDEGRLLALERSFSTGVGNAVKLYEIDTRGAVDVGSLDGIAGKEADPTVSKRLVLDFADLGLTLDNLEGLALGPVLPDGRRTLIVVSDNNFSATQFTQVLAFALDLKRTPVVRPTVETPAVIDVDQEDLPAGVKSGDADDPAIYVHPTDAAKSFFVATLKEGGLQVYDLQGGVLQTIAPDEVRYNNVDLIYGFRLGGKTVDLAVVSDRENDTLAVFSIDPKTRTLKDITGRINGGDALFAGDGDDTAYGLAAYTSPVTGDSYAFVSRRNGPEVLQLKLTARGNKVDARVVRELDLPVPDGLDAEDALAEAMVVDREAGFLYIAQEQVGILKVAADPGVSDEISVVDRVAPDGANLSADVEGLTIYYAADGKGYLLASSQGDSTFAVYRREGANEYLGSFAVGDNVTAGIDGSQEADGAEVVNVPLGPDFPFGVLVVQDGNNDPQFLVDDDGELENSSGNFKLVPWQDVANAFAGLLVIDTESYDPRAGVEDLISSVASGDVDQDSAVLWVDPTYAGELKLEVSTDRRFRRADIIETREGLYAGGEPVRVTVDGLEAGTEYYYRFTLGGDSEVGRFVTAAEANTFAGLRFGATGDWRGELAPYPGLSNADERGLDVFIELGDTIYADFASPDVPQEQATTLDQYRRKNNEVYSQRLGVNTLGDLRATTSVLATIDDHEVINDFAGGAPASSDPRFGGDGLINDTDLYENGLQAFQEYNPLADEFYGATGEDRTAGERKLYRSRTYGSDAAMFVLDARSFRDTELANANPNSPADIGRFLTQSFDATRTMLGRQQLEDLKADLLAAQRAGVTWKFVSVPEPIQNLGLLGAADRFEGYAAERAEILKFIEDNGVQNVVFIAADIHGTVVNNLTYQASAFGPQIASSAFEVVTGSLAFDAPLGPTVIELGAQLGLVTPAQKAFYDTLPVANDADSIPNDKDDFLKAPLNNTLTPLGYDTVGLAGSSIDAELISGDYVAAHTFGWTEFDIDAETQELTVRTWGIAPYTAEDLAADPEEILSREPVIVSEFVVTPKKLNLTYASDGGDLTLERDGDDVVLTEGREVVLRRAADQIASVSVTGTAGADRLTVDLRAGELDLPGGVTFAGGTGTDLLRVIGTSGADELELSGQNVLANGLEVNTSGVEDVTLDAGAGQDVLAVTDAAVTGTVTLAGGNGSDTYRIATTDTALAVEDAGGGSDTLDFSASVAGLLISLERDRGQSQRIGAGNNTLRLTGTVENVIGTEVTDVIFGNSRDNRIEGLGGDDVLYGLDGDDVLIGGAGVDDLFGGRGDDDEIQ